MDDDLTFGTSVWAASEPLNTNSIIRSDPPPPNFDDTISEDFDDFGALDEAPGTDLKEDDFGDFGDADVGLTLAFSEAVGFEEDMRIPGPSSQSWRPLQLDPFPSRPSLEKELNETLGPLWNYEDISVVTTDEAIREVEGSAQILISQSRCVSCKSLLFPGLLSIFKS
jgi:hypothetical protein